ncbi:response regulator SirA [Cellvibrio mixtus]|uniref:Response regulator SirA n=2 Tax=Cellvibrio TaxID=10 RepID=A0A266Q3M2_9GAMM|nr:sulfurtransferase TusA family protein [Cellvibrio mixtus]AQT58963.1 response regulator SirA [Cellvibrio sp. PSBB023]OZY84453.1 response regulator SirA [Cellvibrio mixtus]
MNHVADCFTLSVDVELDAKGLRCPMPLLKAKQALRDLPPAAVLRVLATDAGSVRDFQAYASISGIELVAHEARDGVYCYLLRKPLVSSP